jgi:hypothetical protein
MKRKKNEIDIYKDDPVLSMVGVGKEIWADVGGDAFVASERAAWSAPKKRRKTRRRTRKS